MSYDNEFREYYQTVRSILHKNGFFYTSPQHSEVKQDWMRGKPAILCALEFLKAWTNEAEDEDSNCWKNRFCA